MDNILSKTNLQKGRGRYGKLFLLCFIILLALALGIFELFFSSSVNSYKTSMVNNLGIIENVGLPCYTDITDIGMVKYKDEWCKADDYSNIALNRKSGLNFCNNILNYKDSDVPLIYKKKHKDIINCLNEYKLFVSELQLLDKCVYSVNKSLDRMVYSMFSTYKDESATKDSITELMELDTLYKSKDWEKESDILLEKISSLINDF